MNVEAESALQDVLKNYGRGICDTPRMFEMLLRQNGKASPNEVEALMAAMQHHVVKHLLADPDSDQQALAQTLTVQARQSPMLAKWSVETWAKALGGVKPEERVKHWNSVETPAGVAGASTSIARRALLGLVLVSLAGGFGGAMPGIWVGSRLLKHDPEMQQIVAHYGMKDTANPGQFMIVYGTLGGLAGLVGAGVGWMFGGHTRMTPGRVIGAMLGALQAGSNGAYYGMMNGEGVGTFIGCLIMTGIGTYIATLMGVLVFLAVLGQLAYLILDM